MLRQTTIHNEYCRGIFAGSILDISILFHQQSQAIDNTQCNLLITYPFSACRYKRKKLFDIPAYLTAAQLGSQAYCGV